jgi:hypothetical protein
MINIALPYAGSVSLGATVAHYVFISLLLSPFIWLALVLKHRLVISSLALIASCRVYILVHRIASFLERRQRRPPNTRCHHRSLLRLILIAVIAGLTLLIMTRVKSKFYRVSTLFMLNTTLRHIKLLFQLAVISADNFAARPQRI